MDTEVLRELIRGLVRESLDDLCQLKEMELQEFCGAGGAGGNTVSGAMGGESLGGFIGNGKKVSGKKSRKKAKRQGQLKK
jgi:hypothetical protein